MFKTFLLFFGLLYTLIPFETSNSSLSLQIRLVMAIFITAYALYINGFKIKINTLGKITLILLTCVIVLGVLQSVSLRFFVFSGAIAFASITASVIQTNSKFNHQFLLALKWLIVFSFTMFFLQLGVYTVTGKVIQMHEIVYPLSHARFGFLDSFDLVRMGGIYLEPGTYSNYMYVFLMILLFVDKNLANPLLFIGAISIILSYSVWGMIFGVYLLVVLLMNLLKKYSWKKKFLAILILSIFGFYSLNYFIDSSATKFAIAKVSGDTGSGSVASKQDTYNEYEEAFDKFLIIGEGFDPLFRKGTSSPQDAGFLLNFSVVFGIFFALLILSIFLSACLKWSSWIYFVATMPIFVSKIYYWDYSFWLLFFLIVYSGFSNVRKLNGYNYNFLSSRKRR